MGTVKAIFQKAWPYQQDKMSLPVPNVETAIPFYENFMGFKVVSRKKTPYISAVLARDSIEIAINENGGDPTQDGCFFQVDNIEAAFEELNSNGLKKRKVCY
jgi:catechol 2,3-dioxygenase-like lactoylglutathione lyase family enzyme